MHITLRTAIFCGLAASAAAHIKIANPETRNFNSQVEHIAPCGGSDTADKDSIYNFPLTGEYITVSINDGRGSLAFAHASGESSQSFQSLNITFPYNIQFNPSCFANPGNSGVLQVIAHVTREKTLYQCSDIAVGAAGSPIQKVPSSSANSVSAVGPSALIVLSVTALSLSLLDLEERKGALYCLVVWLSTIENDPEKHTFTKCALQFTGWIHKIIFTVGDIIPGTTHAGLFGRVMCSGA
ncbi:hypothetical protein BJ684DRAFT_16126 [Piptocephalis cylindrospora]|uniref:Copper acquisition factor BIM1-like domain-containing protein n=1 Tax=Piptocephalis cylindrospora TaxID=1907219 RepID=A0A4P9Y3S7_9FUNG|nr:hypothetical protein BJ684DRAFT_16126 [Piptocephalis cylindrospora]|eukprot:RKP13473.1 hypothetical protein BJ684DRAFT_16126 [Piptocephalis cylindrospora]